ncbi:MAG: hypothetical protein AAF958_14950 [Planctomycetota bacterium]
MHRGKSPQATSPRDRTILYGQSRMMDTHLHATQVTGMDTPPRITRRQTSGRPSPTTTAGHRLDIASDPHSMETQRSETQRSEIQRSEIQPADSQPAADRSDAGSTAEARGAYLGIQFECCGVYGRIYKRADGLAYAGHCPRCIKPITIGIRPGGTDCRFFRVR